MRYLLRQGFSLVERNYRTRYGELDLILRHDDILVFAEVKLRRGTGFGEPLEAVTERKQATIRAIAEQYIADKEPEFEQARFDVVGILAERDRHTIEHVQDAF